MNEHHSNGYGLMPSPNLIASSLARRTTDTAICVMGNSLALYNPPTRVAEEFAMIDVISGGRLIAGFPVGTPMDTCYAYGTNPSQLRQRYHEAHDLVLRAWTEQDTFAFNGRFNQQRYVNIWPRPVQRPHPPIWIPGGGSVETWQLVRRDGLRLLLSVVLRLQGRPCDDGWLLGRNGAARQGPQPVSRRLPAIRRRRRNPPARLRSLREAAEYFYGRCLHVDARWATPPGYTSEGSQRAGIESQIKQAADANVRGKSTGERFASVAREMDAIVDKGYVIIGSPDEVAEQLREVAVNLNVGHLMLLLQFGNMSKDLTRYNTQLFAETGDAEAARACSPNGRTAGGRSRWRRRSARTCRPSCRNSQPNKRSLHVSEPETLTIDVNGFPTRVWRKGSGPKLGFLAGFGGLPRWVPFLDELAKSRTVIVPSLPGFPGGDRGHTVLDSHLDWLLAVRESAGQGGPGWRRSGRQFGRRVAGAGDGGAVAGIGAAAGADRAVRPVRREAIRRPIRGRNAATRCRA